MSVTAAPARIAEPVQTALRAGRLTEPRPAPPLTGLPRVTPSDSGTPAPARSWAVDAADAFGPGEGAGPVRSVPPEDPGAWSGSLVRAAVEALTGSRPVAQLARWLTGDLYDVLSRRSGLAVRIKGRPATARPAVVRSVRVCQLSPLVAEAAVVVHDGARVRAAAVRIEAHRGRWRATALDIG
jgi:hypothetical protein